MRFDFPTFIYMVKDHFIENAGKSKSTLFMLNPLIEMTDCDVSQSKVSRWINKRCGIDENIRAAAGRKDGIDVTLKHFKNHVINDFNQNMIYKIVSDLKIILEKDTHVDDLSKSKLLDIYSNDEMDVFLAQCFLYVVSAQTNSELSLSLSNQNTSGIDESVKFIKEQDQHKEIESVIPAGIGLPENEAHLITSDDYDLTVSAKDSSQAFVVYASVKADDIPNECESFIEYMNDLCFRGVSGYVRISSMRIVDYKGNVLLEKKDPLYIGKCIPIPPIRIKDYRLGWEKIMQGRIYITPPQNIIDLEVCDQEGNLIREFREYTIRRERTANTCTAFFIDDKNDSIYFEFRFVGPRELGDKKTPLNVSVNIRVKRINDARSNLDYYELVKKLNEAERLYIWKRTDNKRELFMDFPGLKQGKPDHVATYNDMIDIFRKIILVEQGLGTAFDISDFSNSNILRILQLYKLLTEGSVELGSHDYIIPDEFYEECRENLPDQPGEGLFLCSVVSDIEVFGKKHDLPPRYKIAIWASEVVDEDKKITLKADKSIMYDVENENIIEAELIGIATRNKSL